MPEHALRAGVDEPDVLILGGGPAGAACALTLAREAPHLDVHLVEAKPEGGGERWDLRSGEVLFARHRRELDRLGVPVDDAPWALHALQRFRVVTPDGREHRTTLPWASRLVEIRRGAYDQALRDHAADAGVHVHHATRAVDATMDAGRVTAVRVRDAKGEREVRARWVVDAGGRFAILPRLLGLKEEPREGNHAVVTAWVRDFPQDRDVWEILFQEDADTVEISTPVPGLTRLGLGTPMDALENTAGGAEGLFRARARLNPELARRLDAAGPVEATWTTAPVAYRVRAPRLQNALLVGDARGYLTPFYGDGNLIALRTGRLAGRLIRREAGGGAEAAGAYRHEHARLNRRDAWRAQALRVFNYPFVVNGMFRTPTWRWILRAQMG